MCLYVFVCGCVYVCAYSVRGRARGMCVYVRACALVRARACACACVCVYACICVYVSACMHIYVPSRKYVSVRTRECVYVCVCVYNYVFDCVSVQTRVSCFDVCKLMLVCTYAFGRTVHELNYKHTMYYINYRNASVASLLISLYRYQYSTACRNKSVSKSSSFYDVIGVSV